MSKSFEVPAKPAVLEWARTTVGLSVDQAAKAVGVKPDLLRSWEAGSTAPTFSVLEELAVTYKRTVAVLLLSEPPASMPQPTDFRAASGIAPRLSRESRLALRRALWLQQSVGEIRTLAETRVPVGHASLNSDIEALAEDLRQRIGVTGREQLEWDSDYRALRAWRSAIEAQGVLVLQLSLPLDELRGFSLTTGIPPAVVLAGGDFVRARIFTLFHEYSHLLLGEAGICFPERSVIVGVSSQSERFCSSLAGAILVTSKQLETDQSANEIANAEELSDRQLDVLASRYHVSRPVMLYRLHDLNYISKELFRDKWREWQLRGAGKGPPKQAGGRGMGRAEKRILQYGERLVSRVLEAQERGEVTTGQALEILSLRLRDLPEAASLVGAAQE